MLRRRRSCDFSLEWGRGCDSEANLNLFACLRNSSVEVVMIVMHCSE